MRYALLLILLPLLSSLVLSSPSLTIPIPEPFNVVSVTPYNHGFLIAGYRVSSVLGVSFLNQNVNITANINVSVYYTNISSYQLVFTKEIQNVFLIGNSPLLTIQLNGTLLLIYWTSLFNSSITLYENANIEVYTIGINNVEEMYSTVKTLFSSQMIYPSQIFEFLPYLYSHAVFITLLTNKDNLYFITLFFLPSEKETTTTINGTEVKINSPVFGMESLFSTNEEYSLTLFNTTVVQLIPESVVGNTLYVAEVSAEQLEVGNSTMFGYNITYVALSNGKVSLVNTTLLYYPNITLNNVYYMITSLRVTNVYNLNTTFEVGNNGFKILSQYVITPQGDIKLPVFPAVQIIAGNEEYFLAYQNGTYYVENEEGEVVFVTHSEINVIGNIGFGDFLEVSFPNGTNDVIYPNGSVLTYVYKFTPLRENIQVFNSSYGLLPLSNTTYLLFNRSGLPCGIVSIEGSYKVFYNNTGYGFNESIYGLNITEFLPSPVKVVIPKFSLRIILMSSNGVPIQGIILLNGEKIMVGLNGYTLTVAGTITITAEANGYIPNATTVYVGSNGTLVIYLKPLPFNVTVNGEKANVTEVSQGVYSLNVTEGEEVRVNLGISNYTAYLNGSVVSSLTFNFTQAGVYNLTVVYDDPEVVFLIHVVSKPTTVITTTTTTTSATSTTTSSTTTTTTSTTTSNTTTSSQIVIPVSPPVSSTTSSNVLPLVLLVVIIGVAVMIAIIILRR